MRAKPLIPLLSNSRWARVSLCILLSSTVSISAQMTDRNETWCPRDQNSDLRTCTWSIYTEGGLSWATNVWYQDINAKRSYKQSPAVGGGVDFTIRPWVRVGAEYLWSRYRREQRFLSIAPKTMPVKAYGNYLMNYHNAKLGVGFNFMELWARRRAQWLNIWVGTSVGYTFAKGNEYAITFSSTKTQGGQTSPIDDGTSVGNDSDVTIAGNVRTTNRHERFNKLYIPASLHIEADVNRHFTIGLKGEMDWLMNRKEIAPKNLIFALATVRYNFMPSRTKELQTYYENELSALNDRVNALQQDIATERARAEREVANRQRVEQQQAELQRRLADCENSKSVGADAVQPSHFVQFAHNSSYMSREEADRLRVFAQSVRGHKLTLIAEASTPGSDSYNQQLSERRLAHVVEALMREGFTKTDMYPQVAIGERNGNPAAEGRRVTIKVEK